MRRCGRLLTIFMHWILLSSSQAHSSFAVRSKPEQTSVWQIAKDSDHGSINPSAIRSCEHCSYSRVGYSNRLKLWMRATQITQTIKKSSVKKSLKKWNRKNVLEGNGHAKILHKKDTLVHNNCFKFRWRAINNKLINLCN